MSAYVDEPQQIVSWQIDLSKGIGRFSRNSGPLEVLAQLSQYFKITINGLSFDMHELRLKPP